MESRKRLRPWLWKHTDAGDYGLRWVNKEEGTFRIPWMHRSNRSWNKDHCQVFKEWAKFTMRYNEGEEEDYPGWKTRMRTSLTKLKQDFEEVHALHNLEHDANPYKVYRFKNNSDPHRDTTDSSSSPVYSPSSSQSTDMSHCSPLSNFSQVASPYNIVGNIPNIIESDDSRDMEHNGNMNIAPTVSGQPFDNGLTGDQTTNDTDSFGNVEMPSLPSNSGNLPSDLYSLDSANLISEKLPSNEIGIYNTDPNPNLEEIPVPQPIPSPRRSKIGYEIYYLDEIVKEGQLNDEIYHFYFGQIPPVEVSPIVFGPKESVKIEFPDVTQMKRSINSEQQRLIQTTLMQMNRGFLLKWHNSDIFVQRLCPTRIYANSPFMKNKLLDRKSKEPTKVFDFKEFCENYLGDNRQPPVAVLSFAQELKLDSLKTSLMRIKFTSLEAEEHFSTSSGNSLQISDLNSGDQELAHKIEQLNIGGY